VHVEQHGERLRVPKLEAHRTSRVARHHDVLEREARLGEHGLEREAAQPW